MSRVRFFDLTKQERLPRPRAHKPPPKVVEKLSPEDAARQFLDQPFDIDAEARKSWGMPESKPEPKKPELSPHVKHLIRLLADPKWQPRR